MDELIYILNMFIALMLGAFVGLERKMRYKEAGIRTHAIVAGGSCLMMLISKHGFEGADSARVAAQIVSGIGFLGAGMILYKRNMVHGLTTAAGIWTTAGIGMAIGAKMYILGAGAAALIVCFQYFLHKPSGIFKIKHFDTVRIKFQNTGPEDLKVKELFDIKSYSRFSVSMDGDTAVTTAVFKNFKEMTDAEYQDIVISEPFILSVEKLDDEI